jgi:hypothetical protein
MLREPTLPLPAIDAPDETTPLAPGAQGTEETTPLAPMTRGKEETIPLSPVRRHGDRRRVVIPVVLVAVVLLLTLAIAMVEARDRSILQRAQREARAGLRVAVPELAGVTVSEAQDALADVGLVVGEVRLRPGEAGIVISTDPPAGDRVRRNTSVTLIVGASTPSTNNPPNEHKDHGKHKGEEKKD